MKKIFITIILLLFFPCIGNAKKIEIKGICGDIVIIGEKTLKVGDIYEGMEIIAIDENSVTFKEKNGGIFTQEFKVTSWDLKTAKFKKTFSETSKKKGLWEGFIKAVKEFMFTTEVKPGDGTPEENPKVDEYIIEAKNNLVSQEMEKAQKALTYAQEAYGLARTEEKKKEIESLIEKCRENINKIKAGEQKVREAEEIRENIEAEIKKRGRERESEVERRKIETQLLERQRKFQDTFEELDRRKREEEQRKKLREMEEEEEF